MQLRAFAGLFGCWLLIGTTSSCSGDTASFDSPPGGGSASGGSGGASAGSANKGGASANAGSSNKAGSATGGTNTGGTSNPEQPSCDTAFDELDRSCTSADDCVLVQHQLDCCGTILVMGLNASEEPAFDALEQYCSAQYPACGCPPGSTQLEDGSVIELGSTPAGVECADQRCRSRNTQATTSCGDKACTADQYCYQFIGGPAGSVPSYSCSPLNGCQDCDCLNIVGCECSATASGIKVFCAAP